MAHPDQAITEREQRAVERWKPARRWYHPALAALVIRTSQLVMRRLNTLEIEGLERFDDAMRRPGSGLLTFSNHVSMFDDPLLAANFGRSNYEEIRWVASDVINFFGSAPKAWFFTAGKCVPVVRGGGIEQDGIGFLSGRLRAGDWVHIFPEGGRTRDPRALMRPEFKPGIGRLIAEAQPIALPFYHYGMHHVLPVGSSVPRRGHSVRLVFGEPTYCNSEFVRRFAAAAGNAPDQPHVWRTIAAWACDELRALELRVHPRAGEETSA